MDSGDAGVHFVNHVFKRTNEPYNAAVKNLAYLLFEANY